MELPWLQSAAQHVASDGIGRIGRGYQCGNYRSIHPWNIFRDYARLMAVDLPLGRDSGVAGVVHSGVPARVAQVASQPRPIENAGAANYFAVSWPTVATDADGYCVGVDPFGRRMGRK